MAAENITFNRRATLAWQSSSPGSRQAQPVQIDPSIALRLRLEASPGGRPAPGRAEFQACDSCITGNGHLIQNNVSCYRQVAVVAPFVIMAINRQLVLQHKK